MWCERGGTVPDPFSPVAEHPGPRKGLGKRLRRSFVALLWSYVRRGPSDHGKTDVIEHTIDTGDAEPIRQRGRRVPHALRPLVEEQIDRMIESGIVRPSNSSWASPIVLVRKKDGTYRFCVDYRSVNAVAVKDSFPLPRIDETFDALSGARYYSMLDLASGYWQVLMRKDAVAKSAFVTERGLFEFTVMPFGLTNAPATFQRLMERVLRRLTWEHCLVYLDDILIFSKSFEEHVTGLTKVLQKLREAGLKAKPAKCQFGRRSVNYLGHVVSADGLAPEDEKIRAVTAFPVPKSVEQVRSFVGLAGYYRRFVPDSSTIAKPLFDILKKGCKFHWTDRCDGALKKLQRSLTEAPILTFPRFEEVFCVATDASNVGLGAVLFHRIDGAERVVSYASRTLSPAEQKYAVVEKEALGLVWAVTHFRVYLLGKPFVLITDHCPLKWLKTLKDPNGRIARWIMTLSEYQWDIQHRSGKENANADALSRQPVGIANADAKKGDGTKRLEELLPPLSEEKLRIGAVGIEPRYTMKELRVMQGKDALLARVKRLLVAGKSPLKGEWKSTSAERLVRQNWSDLYLRDGVLCRRVAVRQGAASTRCEQIVVPKVLVSTVLTAVHDQLGHLGIEKTTEKVRGQFWWPGYSTDVIEYIRKCEPCSQRKAPSGKQRAPMESVTIGRPMEMIALDFVGPLPTTIRGNRHLLVIGDYYTKWIEAVPTRDQTAEMSAQALLEQIGRHGVPMVIHSDQGPAFEGKLIREMCRLLGTDKTRTTSDHPQCDGLVERTNRTLLDILSKYVEENQRDWDLKVPLALFGYRTAAQSSTGVSPFEMLYGRKARTTAELAVETRREAGVEPQQYFEGLEEKLAALRGLAEDKTIEAQERQRRAYDGATTGGVQLEEGDRVWLYTPRVKAGRKKKLAACGRALIKSNACTDHQQHESFLRKEAKSSEFILID